MNDLKRAFQKIVTDRIADAQASMEKAVQGNDIGRAREVLGEMNMLRRAPEILIAAIKDAELDEDDDKDDDKSEQED